MKILLPIDGSAHSQATIQEFLHSTWPEGTQVEILSVAHPAPEILDPLLVGRALHYDSLNKERKRARHDVEEATRTIRQGTRSLEVTPKVLDGSPAPVILKEAEEWQPDLIMMGSHGRGRALSLLLGSVAQAVTLHATCPVKVVRQPVAETTSVA